MAPRFSHAEARPDGGTDFFAPDGSRQTLYGAPAAAYGASLPKPPSLATSDGALADASDMPTGTTFDMTRAPTAEAPRADFSTSPLQPGAPSGSALTPANGWGTAQVTAPNLGGAAPAVDLSGLTPEAAGKAFGLKAPRSGGGGTGSSEADVRVSLGLQEAPAPKGGKASGGAIGISDVTPRAPTTEAEAKAAGYTDLDDARAAFKASLDAEIRAGSRSTPARWQGTTRSTVREGVASDATQAAREAALDAQGAAAGRQAEVARGQDLADESALREAARRGRGTMARLDTAAGIEEKALLDREARLRSEADKSPLGFARGSALGALDEAGTRYAEAGNVQEGDAILTSANGGGSVASIMAAKQAAKDARLGRRDKQLDEADRARVGVAAARQAVEKIKSAEYADYLTTVLKGNAAEYKAAGRLPELEATLAALADKKAALRGDREAKQMGNTTSGEKFIPATSGGANRAAALAKYGERMLHVAGAQNQADAADARAAAAAAKQKNPELPIGDQRVTIDPNLPDQVKTKLYEQAAAQNKAERALSAIEKDLNEMGPARYAPGAIGKLMQGPAGARIRANVQAYTRNESVSEGGGALQEGERKAAEDQFLSDVFAKGTIEAKKAKLNGNRKDLLRTATGRD